MTSTTKFFQFWHLEALSNMLGDLRKQRR